MHIVFVDIVYGYRADRPDEDEPLGGTTSAICFLARELVARGVRVSLVNTRQGQAEAWGIPAYPIDQLLQLALDPTVSAFVFCGRWDARMVQGLRFVARAPFIAWMHEACFEDTFVQNLAAFDGLLFVSAWQAQMNAASILPHQRSMILRNAMNPRFADLYAEGEDLLPSKTEPPVILYAGDYQRGAMHIPQVLVGLCALETDFTVEMYTDARFSPEPDENQAVIDFLKGTAHLTHMGKVGQTALAQAMKRASIFLAPNPWPETSCINLIQAMAAGLWCITSDRAALPETGHGFSQLVPIEEKDTLLHFRMPVDAKAYAVHLALALRARRADPHAWGKDRERQRAFYLAHYQWSQRAEPFISFVSTLKAA